MNDYYHLKPKYRSGIRSRLGRIFYTCKRFLFWYLGGDRYTKTREFNSLEYLIYTHSTPLYRKLRNVEMWLQHNKVDNLKVAIRRIDGVVIKPGETFSYWKLIGKPTYSKGYKDGMVLHYGQFKSGVGGGLCQLSNMIYWMSLHTPLTVVERHRHSFDVFPDSNRTQPLGSGATCVYNYRDLRVLNNTNETYQLRLSIEGDSLIGKIVSDRERYFNYEVYEKEHSITHHHWGGYIRHNEVRRKVVSNRNEIVDDLFVCKNDALMMYEPFLDWSENDIDCGK